MKNIRAIAVAITVFSGLVGSVGASLKNQTIQIRVRGQEQVVFRSGLEGCDLNDIPDSALRGIRRNDNTVIAFASHWTNLPFVVDSSLKFTRNCKSAFVGSSTAEPKKADDRGWLAALWKLPKSTVVVGIVHNEYQGNRHPGHCRFASYVECWTNSLTMAISNDDGAKFALRRPNYIVAAGPAPYSKSQGARYGYQNPSNIIFFRSYYYMAASVIDIGGIHRGACLMRTNNIDNPTDWKGWDGSTFTLSLLGGVTSSAAIECRSPQNLGGVMGSFVRIRGTTMVALFSLRTDLPNLTKAAAVTYSVSSDMRVWSKPKVLMELEPYWATRCDDAYRYNYPSVIDFMDESENLTGTGKSPNLFLVRAAVANCGVTMSRDLVRIPLEIELPSPDRQDDASQPQ